MHPATRILLCLISALALPGLSFFYLAALSLLLVAWGLLDARARWLALLGRTRWLYLALVLGYGFSVPGEAIVAGQGWSPTHEGLHAGLMQAWRLSILLLIVDRLVLVLEPERLLAGVYGLLAPLAGWGRLRERIALRLGLTIQAIAIRGEGRPALSRLLAYGEEGGTLPEHYELPLPSWRWRDGLAIFGAFSFAVWTWQAV